jgi:hypothetical protein
MMLKAPFALLMSATAGAVLLATPMASATTGTFSTTATCTSKRADTTSPAVGASKAYRVGSVGTVTIKRTATRTLAVVSTAPVKGYTTRVRTASGARINVAFRKTGSTVQVYFGASPGRRAPGRLHTAVTTCT